MRALQPALPSRSYQSFRFQIRSQDCVSLETWSLYLPISIIWRSEEHTSELQSLMRISYAVFCLKKKIQNNIYNIKNKSEIVNKSSTIIYKTNYNNIKITQS